MKIKNITTLIAGLAIPAVASAQLYNLTGPGPIDLMKDMAGSVKYLYSDDNNAATDYETITFTTDLFKNLTPTIGTGLFKTDAANPQFSFAKDNPGDPFPTLNRTTVFKEVEPNFSSFIVNGAVDIGFFGREATDQNKLILNAISMDGLDTTQQTDPLFFYSAGNSTPKATTLIPRQNPIQISFFHQDITANIGAPLVNPLKFKIFQSVTPLGAGGNEFILAIDDRMESLIDFDDGFFYVTGAITPVPEPSLIAGLAVLGMGGFLVIRRKLIAKRKQA